MDIEKLKVIFEQIETERENQNIKWGEQNHPCLDKVLLERKGGCTPTRMTQNYNLPTESLAKYICDLKSKRGDVTWTDIALEEFVEVVSEFDPQKRRKELVQLSAVVVAWIEKLDRDLENLDYMTKCKNFLTFYDVDFSKDVIFLTDGGNSVVVNNNTGDFSKDFIGSTINEVAEYVAKKEGKKTEWID